MHPPQSWSQSSFAGFRLLQARSESFSVYLPASETETLRRVDGEEEEVKEHMRRLDVQMSARTEADSQSPS